jgi:LysM repeat protein
MRSRAWGFLIVVIILAAVVLTILLVWGHNTEPASPTSAATSPTPPLVAEATPAPTLTPTPTPTPMPLVYTVQEGDTLSAIALRYGITVEDIVSANGLPNPDALNIGQQLVIPGHFVTPTPAAPTAAPTDTPVPDTSSTTEPASGLLPTLTPSGPPVVEIGQVLGAGNLPAEVVIVRNRGGLANLEGWMLSDAEGNAFTFPSLILFDGAEVRVHSEAGTSAPTDLYWGRTAPAWNSGELLTLRDAAGNVVNTYIVP